MSNTRIIEIPATMQTGKGKNHAIRKLRVAAYCRVSTEEEEQQSSLKHRSCIIPKKSLPLPNGRLPASTQTMAFPVYTLKNATALIR